LTVLHITSVHGPQRKYRSFVAVQSLLSGQSRDKIHLSFTDRNLTTTAVQLLSRYRRQLMGLCATIWMNEWTNFLHVIQTVSEGRIASNIMVIQWLTGAHFPGVKRPGREAEYHLQLEIRSKKYGFVHPFPHTDRLCGLVVRVLANRSGGPGSIPGTTRKKNVVGLERGALSLVSTNWGATW
jgi:hypothetical protein